MPDHPPTDTAATPRISDHSERPFAIARCIQCDYDLTGIPAPKTCPECGMQYDASALLITGISRTRQRRPFGRWILLLPLFAIIGTPILTHFIGGTNAFTIVMAVTVLVFAVPLIRHVIFHRQSLGWLDMHLYLDGTGVASCPAVGDVRFIPWVMVRETIRLESAMPPSTPRGAPPGRWWTLQFRPIGKRVDRHPTIEPPANTPAARFTSAPAGSAISLLFTADPATANTIADTARALRAAHVVREPSGMAPPSTPTP